LRVDAPLPVRGVRDIAWECGFAELDHHIDNAWDLRPSEFQTSGCSIAAGPGTRLGRQLQRTAVDLQPGAALDARYRALCRRLLLDRMRDKCLLPAPPLPPEWEVRDGYNPVRRGRWRWAHEHINVKEARAALLGLRRAARSEEENFGRKLISLVDSLVAPGVFEKGRSSRSPARDVLCRRAVSIQLRCQISWRLRHVATVKNVADYDSGLRVGDAVEKNQVVFKKGADWGEDTFIT
jgi:hypothetical protein